MFVFLVRSEPLRGAGVSSLADEEGMLIWECRSLAGMQLAEPRLHHFDNNLAFIKQTKLSRAAIGEEGGDGFFKGRGTDNQDEMAPRGNPPGCSSAAPWALSRCPIPAAIHWEAELGEQQQGWLRAGSTAASTKPAGDVPADSAPRLRAGFLPRGFP